MAVMVSLPAQLALAAAEGDEREAHLVAVNRALTRATPDFIVMARHDAGILEDRLGKTPPRPGTGIAGTAARVSVGLSRA